MTQPTREQAQRDADQCARLTREYIKEAQHMLVRAESISRELQEVASEKKRIRNAIEEEQERLRQERLRQERLRQERLQQERLRQKRLQQEEMRRRLSNS